LSLSSCLLQAAISMGGFASHHTSLCLSGLQRVQGSHTDIFVPICYHILPKSFCSSQPSETLSARANSWRPCNNAGCCACNLCDHAAKPEVCSVLQCHTFWSALVIWQFTAPLLQHSKQCSMSYLVQGKSVCDIIMKLGGTSKCSVLRHSKM